MPGVFPTLSTGGSFRYPIDREIDTRSQTYRFCDFSEQSFRRGYDSPQVDFSFTWNQISTADKNLIREFHAQQNGREATDWALFFDGFLYRNCQFLDDFNPQYIGPNLWSVTMRVRTLTGNLSGENGTAGASGPIALPHGPVNTATISVIAEYIRSTTLTAPTLGVEISTQAIGLLSPPNIFRSNVAFGKTTISGAISADTVLLGQAALVITIDSVGMATGPDLVNPDRLRIYDSWINIVYADGTLGMVRPSSVNVVIQTSEGDITGAGNAIDGDPDTYAELTRWQYTNLALFNVLYIGGFNTFT